MAMHGSWGWASLLVVSSIATGGEAPEPALPELAGLTAGGTPAPQSGRPQAALPEPALPEPALAEPALAEPGPALEHLKAAVGTVPSRVVGSPDPPPPYRVARVLPELKLSFPVAAVNEPGSRRLLFIDQDKAYGRSRLRRTGDAPESGEVETLLDFGDDVLAYSVAVHPRFAENGYIYLGSKGPPLVGGAFESPAKAESATQQKDKEAKKPPKTARIVRYTIAREPTHRFEADSATVILEWVSDGHDGCAVAFGLDGMMYVTTGDGTSDSDTNLTGQGLDHLLAKVLRIDVDHPDEGRAYSVPKDNPFVGKDGVRPETWAYGFRNPWRMAVDPGTGHVWVGNNGQDLWEQVYLVERGANYGWSVYEGSHIFYANRQLGPTPVSKPMFEHHHSISRSLTGGVVYYGTKLPELRGAYLYGDHSTGKIWGAKVESLAGQGASLPTPQARVAWHKELADSTLQITSFALDAEGELLISDHRGDGLGGFYTLEPTPDTGAGDVFPRTLSASGLFESVPGHRLHVGAIPYSVNAALWSDGAHKERAIVLPQDDPHIDFRVNRGWEFPNGTVLVKSFALDGEEAGTRRWVETRFLTRLDNEWVGYSYAWNDEQTDAELVGSEGRDRAFEVRTPDGVRRQTWHYPSRTECMVCHSRAANFVLGPSTLQMNRDHDYGGVTANQLAVLDWLGDLRGDWREQMRKEVRKRLKQEGLSSAEIDEQMPKTSEAETVEPLSLGSLSTYPRLVDPYDAAGDLAARARSYLHANCAQCHVEAGGGNAQIDLEFTTALDKMRLVDEPPLHHRFELPDARLVAPGAPDRSVLLYRMAHRGPGQMPQLATVLVDEAAVALVREWIDSLR